MRHVATLIVLAAVLAVPQAAAKEPVAPTTVFGILWQNPQTLNRQTSFAELDALTLEPVSKTVPLGKAGWYLGRSPGGGYRAAFAVGEGGDSIRFVDVSTMTPEKRVQLPCSISTHMLWETANRLIVTCTSSASSILVVDPVKQRLVSRKALRGELGDVETGHGLLVGVLAPLGKIGPARLVEVNAKGITRTASLPGIRAGTTVLDSSTSRYRIERPAVAIEPSARRAAVVPATGGVTIVDLSTLAAMPYAVRTLTAARKNIEGSERTAIWTWGGTIAVGGWDWTADGQPDHSVAAGVTLIDTTSWTSRRVDSAAAALSYTGLGGVLLACGSVWDFATQKSIGTGLTGFGVDGTQRFHLFGSDPVGVAAIAGTYAYVPTGGYDKYTIIDTMAGKIIGTAHPALPTTIFPTRPNF
jgi:hypothetical protein